MNDLSAAAAALDLLRRYYDAFNRGDREEFLALLDDDVVHEVNEGGSERGLEAFAAFLVRMDRCYAEQAEELETMVNADGTRGAAEFYIRGTYLETDAGLPEASGQNYRIRVGAFFEFAGGKVARVTNYYNLAEWLRQIGG